MSLGHSKKRFQPTVYIPFIAQYVVKFPWIPIERRDVCASMPSNCSCWEEEALAVSGRQQPAFPPVAAAPRDGEASRAQDVCQRGAEQGGDPEEWSQVSGSSRFYSWACFCIVSLVLVVSTSQEATACPGRVLCLSTVQIAGPCFENANLAAVVFAKLLPRARLVAAPPILPSLRKQAAIAHLNPFSFAFV